MNHTYWNDTTPLWRGTAEPYRMPNQPGAAGGDVFTGHNKPSLLSPEWLSENYHSADSRRSDLLTPQLQGAMGSFHTKPLAWPTQSAEAAPALASAVQQLTQAMAVFAVPAAGLLQPAEQPLFAPALQMAVDVSLFA